MDAQLVLWWVVFLGCALGAGLLIGLGWLVVRSGEARFQFVSVGSLFLLVVLSMLLGLPTALTLWALGLWGLAILRANTLPVVAEEPVRVVAHHE